MKTLKDFNFKGKNVLLRADLNSDVKKGKVLMSERIKESSKTINFLKRKKAKIVVIAHQGRPGKTDFLSLKQHAALLNKFTKIKFVDDILGKKAEKAIKNLKKGEAILLDNVRFEKDEFNPGKKDNKLLKLAEKADIYVNDSFSVCHRNESSIILFPRYMKSCAGLLLEKEINALKKIKIKKALFILGGAKPEDNIKLLKRNKVLACGLFGQVCLINKGKKLGEQENYLKKQKALIKIPKDKLKNVETPIDFAVKKNNKRTEIKLEDFPSDYEIFDIGKKSIEKFKIEIKKARAVFMKGPLGYCEEKQFQKGTAEILKAISSSKIFSVIGGGHLSTAIKDLHMNKKYFSHISLSGGALVSYLAGKKLPGLEALDTQKSFNS